MKFRQSNWVNSGEQPAPRIADPTGGSRLHMLTFLLATTILVFATVSLGPVLITTHHFSEAVRDEIVHGKPMEKPSAVRSRVRERAEELGLPVRERDIRVEKRGRWCQIEVHYSVPVRIVGGLVWDLEFSAVHEGESVPPLPG